ncbi:hypothetical protein JCM6882_002198 [Rhodosporidiobolus microsporus]
MNKLPDELIVRVGEHLDAGRQHPLHRGAYQRGLASLTRASKRLHGLLLPLLYAQPLFLNCKQAETWTRTYTSLVDPFKRASAGKAWPPKLLKPHGLICTPWFSFNLPNLSNALYEIGVFTGLTSITLSKVSLDTNFLPLLLAPGSSCRTVLQSLSLDECLAVTPLMDYDRTLAFLFESIELAEETWKDVDLAVVRQLTYRRLRLSTEHCDCDSASDSDFDSAISRNYDEEDETLQAAHRDYSLFCQIWEGEGGPGCPELPFYPNCCPFSSLASFSFELTSEEQLYLIIYTSSFPVLRRLVLSGTLLSSVRFDLSDLETLRMSITRHDPQDQPGLLFLPSAWEEETLEVVSEHVDSLSLVEGEPVPPLSPEEVEAFTRAPYDGPHLDLLDLRKAQMVIMLPE